MAVEVAFARETAPGERRVALTPETCKKLARPARVRIERGAGLPRGFPDAATPKPARASSTTHAPSATPTSCCACSRPRRRAPLAQLKQGRGARRHAATAGRPARVQRDAVARSIAFPLERLPRTTRAQAMDVLSSQAGMAGYKAVLIAAQLAPRFFPMLTTAAGTIRPSKVLIVGAGVAGLQAIATAKRLGAQVEGFDVRPETREQIESLGGKFLDLGVSAAGEGGYARQLTDEERAEQQRRLGEHLRTSTSSCARPRCRAAPRRRSSPRRWSPA
jgi:NAD(P) transhydrogenase subunit alpha